MALPKVPRVGSRVWDALHSKHGSTFHEKVMNEEAWELHRRAGLRHRPRPQELMHVLLGYAGVLGWVALLSAAVAAYDLTLVRIYKWPMMTIQCVQTFFGAITFALTLMLVFKNNASYGRWLDARRSLGMLTSTAHNLARQSIAFFPPHQAHLTAAMLRWTAASMWAVKALVRPKAPLQEELQGVLLPSERTWLLAQPHKPLAVGQALSAILQATDLDTQTKSSLDKTITTFTYEFGACNRIYNTAIPAAYTRHTSRFLMCYICALPMLMWPLAGWGAPLLSVAIAFLVLGVEHISAVIEEPFKVLAFDSFCQAINRDMQTALSMLDATAAAAAGGALGRPGRLSPDSRTPQAPPVVAGLNAPMSGEAEAAPGAVSASAAPCSRISNPETHLNPFWAVHKAGGSAGSTNAGFQLPFAAGAAVAPAAPLAAVLPVPAVLPINTQQQQAGQLQAGPPTPAESPTEAEGDSPCWGVQHRAPSRPVELRRSFDVGAAGRPRRPIHAVNSRTSLLSMISGNSAAPTS